MGWFSRTRSENDNIRVLRSDARVDDSAALDRLLQALPEGGELRLQLLGRFFARAWDKGAARDYWVSSDGTQASCYTVCGLNLKQAAAVRVRWDALEGQSALSERLLAELVSAETGATVQVISFVSCERAAPLEPSKMMRSA